MEREHEETETTGAEREPEQSVPRIYVASLADYVAGNLVGRWVDAAQDYENLDAEVQQMLAASPTPQAEEWAIHDYEGFGSLRLSEYESLSIVSMIAKGIAERGPAFAAWADIVNREPEALARFEEAYQGTWASLTEYAEQLVDDMGIEAELDRHFDALRPYIRVDCEALGRDMELGGDIYAKEADDGSVHVFYTL